MQPAIAGTVSTCSLFVAAEARVELRDNDTEMAVPRVLGGAQHCCADPRAADHAARVLAAARSVMRWTYTFGIGKGKYYTLTPPIKRGTRHSFTVLTCQILCTSNSRQISTGVDANAVYETRSFGPLGSLSDLTLTIDAVLGPVSYTHLTLPTKRIV